MFWPRKPKTRRPTSADHRPRPGAGQPAISTIACPVLRKVCYGRWTMNRCMPIAPAIPRRECSHLPRSLAFVVFALALCAATLGCNQTPGEIQTADYGATVEALLPTADPTVPPTPTPLPTSAPPTDTPEPTYTPRPQPTYAPRPTPAQATTEDRQPAIPFNAQMLDGSEFALTDAYGSPTLLAFWAPW